jgi:hypothetical protein
MENKVSAKYKTKNIKTDGKEVFLATINQRRANTISSRNFTLTATRLYKVWLSGSFVCPFKKIRIVINVIIEKTVERTAASPKQRFNFANDTSKYADNINSIFNSIREKAYLWIRFKNQDHLIKSLTAVYIAAKTPRRERTIVNTGVCQPVSISSFTPPQTVTRIIPII